MTTDVVIGAASGMGEAVARRLARRGHRLLLADRDVEGVERLAADLGAEARACDLTSTDDLAALAATTDDAAGELGALVLTAGLSPTMGSGRLIYDVDIVGPARVLAAFEPLAGDGSVAVLFASMAGHLVPDDPAIDAVLDRPLDASFLDDLAAAGIPVEDPSFAYALSKRAVVRLVRREAKAWGERGARLLSLSPGIIDTPMGRAENEAQPVMVDMVAGSPLGRMIDADEVAAVVDFMVSAAASALTGTDVLVDGGAVATFRG
jgi:NAD(P)-dependent dehydrogenase (short-subunit alcohol dehydrogenase family)